MAPFPEPRRPTQPARVVPAPVYEIASLHEHSRRPEQHEQSQQRELQHAGKPVEKHAEPQTNPVVDNMDTIDSKFDEESDLATPQFNFRFYLKG